MAHPLLYEVNTRCWLRELSDRCGTPLNLGTVPDSELAAWADYGFTHVWLMGVWTTGERARREALTSASLREETRQLLPDWRETDLGGSPYAIAGYSVSEALGGDRALEVFRARLHNRGLKLVLDFVPNHLGLDHPWVVQHPELFVSSPIQMPGTFAADGPGGRRWLAHGRDPYFPPWTDTVQLDYRHGETRLRMIEQLRTVAERCDGVRCDMAMLILDDVFRRTWAHLPPSGEAAEGEFWKDAIAGIRRSHGDFLFLAEAYWGLESALLLLGFDHAYDKSLYDLLVAGDAAAVRRHLSTQPWDRVCAGAHFLENHDEPRIASRLALPAHRAAAWLVLALPGLRLLHDGQLIGARRRIPVQLVRRPAEPPDPAVSALYREILSLLPRTAVGRGVPALLKPVERRGGARPAPGVVLIQWELRPGEGDWVAINGATDSAEVSLPLDPAMFGPGARFTDLLGAPAPPHRTESGLRFELSGHEVRVIRFAACQD
ncbi:MAG TPA: alpha-amylase family glycosyl hydrolase [Candidatus Paceibacterota bacterium]|nr:alpha-amylase family glycosyl hydrolase [Candidatus Paceibacterota bacterium]